MEDAVPRETSARYCKSGSSKWLGASCRPAIACQSGGGNCPSLLDLCIRSVCKVVAFSVASICVVFCLLGLTFESLWQDIGRYSSFSMLPRDVSQQIFNELVYSNCLTDVSFEAFRDCALQVMFCGKD